MPQETVDAKKLRGIKRMCKDHPDEVIAALLEESFWPKKLEPNRAYTRFEDDSPRGHLSISISNDSDGWIEVFQHQDPDEFKFSQRFRTLFGGGQSLRVRNALLVLALAIQKDNEEFPQNRPTGDN